LTWEESLIGTTVGNYELRECIGTGGMGAVFLAENPTVESQVAIKVLHESHLTDEAIVSRLVDEARAVNMVGHQGLVRIHDCHTQEGLGLYLAMELLRGQTLFERYNARGPFPPYLTARLLRQAASALVAAHDAGIIHRDLKPSNVFLVDDAEVVGGLRVKLLDFGVAKLLGDDDPMGERTATGMIIGSPQYMSPEQCLDSKGVDPRTDLFSLGAIGYVLLSGQLPFPGQSIGQVLLAHRRGEAPPLRQLRPEVPPELEAVLMRALAREREQRIPTAQEMEQQLEQVVQQGEASGAVQAELSGGWLEGDAISCTMPDPDAGDDEDSGQGVAQGLMDALPTDDGTLLHDGDMDDLVAPRSPVHEAATAILDEGDDAPADMHDAATMMLGNGDPAGQDLHDQATMMLGQQPGDDALLESETLIDPDAVAAPGDTDELSQDLISTLDVEALDDVVGGGPKMTVALVALALAVAAGVALLYFL